MKIDYRNSLAVRTPMILVYELNQHSFFVTKLSTMGGFLKKEKYNPDARCRR